MVVPPGEAVNGALAGSVRDAVRLAFPKNVRGPLVVRSVEFRFPSIGIVVCAKPGVTTKKNRIKDMRRGIKENRQVLEIFSEKRPECAVIALFLLSLSYNHTWIFPSGTADFPPIGQAGPG